MRVQAAYTKRASACRDAGLSDERRAQAVSATAVANAEEKSTLCADAIHVTLPLKKMFPGRGRWDATPCGRDEGEGVAVAPTAAHFATRDATPRSGLRLLDIFVKPTLACYRPVGVVKRPLSPRRRICQVQGAGMSAPVLGALGATLCRARRAQVAAVVLCREWGGGSWWRSPGAGESWRRGAPESGGG